MRKKIVVLVMGVVVWGVGSSQVRGYDVTPFVVCDAEGEQTRPDISGNTVVWVDGRNEGYHSIYGKNLSTENEFSISTSRTDPWKPAIDGDTIVWTDRRNTGPLNSNDFDYYGYNISIQTEFLVWADGEQRPGIDLVGDTLVGLEYIPTSAIYGYNILSGTRFPICAGPDEQRGGAVTNGNIVVWEDRRTGNWDIYKYDLLTQNESLVITGNNDSLGPGISGDNIVWIDNRNGSSDVYGYSSNTQTEFSICIEDGPQGPIAISNNIVVWQDQRNGNWDIFGYDILTKTEFPIAIGLGDQLNPAISGNTVVWESGGDIYGAVIPEPCSLLLIGFGSLILRKRK